MDVSELVREEVAVLGDEIGRRRLTMGLDLDAEQVASNEQLLRLLIGNLVRSAVRHNRNGGEVRVAWVPPMLSVCNTGEVVPADALTYLTEPSYRLRGRVTSDSQTRGNRLGLTLVANIVDVLGGSIDLEPISSGGLRV